MRKALAIIWLLNLLALILEVTHGRPTLAIICQTVALVALAIAWAKWERA